MPLVTLIRTAPVFPTSSMPAYAQLVEQALAGVPGLDVRVCDLES